MRLFVGVEVSAEVAGATAALIEHLRQRAAGMAPDARITWITPERLHITVRFIGHVDDSKAAAISEVLRPTFIGTPFQLALGGVGTFPPKGSPRVVWVGLTTGRDRLVEVERLVSDRLERVGVGCEERPYNPHLTLARIREAAGLRSAALLDECRDTVLGSTRVDAITLFESRLSPKGPTYVALQRTSLGSA